MSRVSRLVVRYFCLIVLTLTLQITAKSQYCSINSTNQTEIREPIILTNSSGKLDFYIPSVHNGKLTFDQDQKFIIACPNPRNLLTLSNSNVTTGQCTQGKLHVAGKQPSFQELSCNKSIRGDVQRRPGNAACGINGNKQGSLIDIGYYVDVIPTRRRNDFLTLIEVCHDLKMGNTYYSQHVIHGKLIKQASRSRYRPGFSTQGLNISAAVAYKQSYQKATFAKLLGSSILAVNYINNKSFLSRGHLAPDADFLFAPWQFSTYLYLNAVPQWQTVNGGNWHKVESMARKLAGQLGSNVQVITGTHGVLALTGSNKTEVEMYLLPQKTLPVPKYIWKLVYSHRKEAMVLVVLNNPFAKDLSEVDPFCDDVCIRHGWAQENWEKIEKGVVFCCEYHDFARTVHTVPRLDVQGVLHGPKK